MIKEQIDLQIEQFQVSKKGVIEGIAINFNKPILHGGMVNIISPNAFSRTLAEGRDIPLLNQHNMLEPVGLLTSFLSDGSKLNFKANLALKNSKAADVFALVEAGVLKGVSIGFAPSVTRYGKDKQGRRVRYIDDIDLYEVSLVTVPADKDAKIQATFAEDFDEASVKFDGIGEFDAKEAFAMLEERILKLEEVKVIKEEVKNEAQEASEEVVTCSQEVTVTASSEAIQALIDKVKQYDAELIEVIA